MDSLQEHTNREHTQSQEDQTAGNEIIYTSALPPPPLDLHQNNMRSEPRREAAQSQAFQLKPRTVGIIQRDGPQSIETEGVETTPGTAEDARGFIDDMIQHMENGMDHYQQVEITDEVLGRVLDGWLRMVSNGGNVIDSRLNGDTALKERLKQTYRQCVQGLVTRASQVLGDDADTLYARHNERIAWWTRRQLTQRENIVFILGAGDNFYRAANRYFNFTNANLVSNLRSLSEVRDHLASNPPSNGLPWGDVSIVSHANLEGQMMASVTPGGGQTTVDSLNAAVSAGTFRSVDNAIIDNATHLIIRGCALGRNQEILETLRAAFGGNDDEMPHVYAPRHLQAYEYQTSGNATTSADEYFLEFWYVGFPRGSTPGRQQIVTAFTAKYPDTQVDWDQMMRTRGAHVTRNYAFTYDVTGGSREPINQAQLTALAQQTIGSNISNVTETDRATEDDGTITITFDYDQNGSTLRGGTLTGLMPRLNTQADITGFLSSQGNIGIDELEEESNLGIRDFAWSVAISGDTYTFTGRRSLVRIQRELTEPNPDNPDQQRRVQPDITDASQYGREVPEGL